MWVGREVQTLNLHPPDLTWFPLVQREARTYMTTSWLACLLLNYCNNRTPIPEISPSDRWSWFWNFCVFFSTCGLKYIYAGYTIRTYVWCRYTWGGGGGSSRACCTLLADWKWFFCGNMHREKPVSPIFFYFQLVLQKFTPSSEPHFFFFKSLWFSPQVQTFL